jgi:stage V sporulation protein AC
LNTNISDIKQKLEADNYQQLVDQIKPKPNIGVNCLKTFLVGGVICCLGQGVLDLALAAGYSEKDAGATMVITMIFLGALLTGLGVYDKLGKFSGAGSIVPITGFANAIVASAMEFKREGYIFGVGSRIFTIAGPTLLFGFVAYVIVGILYYLLG